MLGDPNTAPQGYDHILCYYTGFTNAFTPVTVKLRDQFYTTPFKATVSQESTVCTPAMKRLLNRKPLKVKPNGHYVCYTLSSSLPYTQQTRTYFNQLESNAAFFYEPYFLCVPTHKYPLSGAPPRIGESEAQPDASPAFDHLMGYDMFDYGATFANPLPATTVELFDQFYPYPSGGFTATLGNPFMLLTPTKKVYKLGKQVTGNGHWVVYGFTSPAPISQTRRYVNQLEKNSVTVTYPNWLFVPTYKYPSAQETPRGRLHGGKYHPAPPPQPATH